MRSRGARVGVDVGGTFTDIVITDPDGAIHTGKLPSTPDDFSAGVAEGVRAVLGLHDVDPTGVRDVVHGSTVATNAILERKGARTGLLTTAGFRDVLELRRLRMPRLYDMTWEKPAPLVERYLRHEVRERIDLHGQVVTPLDVAGARRAIEALVAEGIDSLAVSLLHSYANPAHEQAIGAMLAARLPGAVGVAVAPRPAGHPRVRADEHDGPQCLRPADRRVVPAGVAPPARCGADRRTAADHAVERRDHDRRRCRGTPGVHRRIGAGGRGDRLGRARAAARASTRSSPSTWAARPPRRRSSRAAGRTSPPSSRSPPGCRPAAGCRAAAATR